VRECAKSALLHAPTNPQVSVGAAYRSATDYICVIRTTRATRTSGVSQIGPAARTCPRICRCAVRLDHQARARLHRPAALVTEDRRPRPLSVATTDRPIRIWSREAAPGGRRCAANSFADRMSGAARNASCLDPRMRQALVAATAGSRRAAVSPGGVPRICHMRSAWPSIASQDRPRRSHRSAANPQAPTNFPTSHGRGACARRPAQPSPSRWAEPIGAKPRRQRNGPVAHPDVRRTQPPRPRSQRIRPWRPTELPCNSSSDSPAQPRSADVQRSRTGHRRPAGHRETGRTHDERGCSRT